MDLDIEVSPTQLPLDTACDLMVRVRCSSATPVTIYPAAAKLAAIFSYAGVGITWGLSLTGPNGTLPIRELRRWYGPPGNPPAPTWAKRDAVDLAPGKDHVVMLPACWLPNATLEPAHLDLKALDPDGMDRVDAPAAGSSVIAFAPLGQLEQARRTQVDFLRGNVLAFVPAPGAYELAVEYLQASFMGIGETVHATSAPIRVTIG